MMTRKRLKTVIVSFVVLYGLIVFRAFYYQVIGDAGIEKYSDTQYRSEIVIPPARGAILDRNGKKLAVSITNYSIGATPRGIAGKESVARLASKVLGAKRKTVLARLKSKKSFVFIKRQVNREKAKRFLKEMGKLDEFRDEYRKFERIGDISLIPEPKRYYPGKELASNVIGFCDIDSVGIEGVEKSFDRYLRGKEVRLQCEKDARGRLLVPEFLPDTAVLGNTISLTIDKNIQFICEKEVSDTVKKYKAKGGIAIAMSPRTGEVYAMAAVPSFDPNRPGKYSPWYRKNRVITDVYEPGSTFKVFLLAGAIESKGVKLSDRIFCENGHYRVQGRTIHDTHKRGSLSIPEVIKYSSNIGAVKIAEKLSPGKFYDYIMRFGFGSRTGIELQGESPGILPGRKEFLKPIRYSTAAFGQGVAATPMQVAAAFSTVVNGGRNVRPHIIKEVLDQSGKVIYKAEPSYGQQVISRETSSILKSLMREVLSEEGTGSLARVPGYTIGGKTGTSQKVDMNRGGYSDKRIASFIGFFPYKNPSLVIMVLIDEPEGEVYGGVVAAPAFSRIASKVAIYAGIPPDEDFSGRYRVAQVKQVRPGESPFPARPSVMKVSLAGGGDESFIMPDLSGFTVDQVVDMMDFFPVALSISGSGVVYKQRPAPGERMRPGKRCRVYFD